MVDTEGHKRINFTPNRLICYPHISFTRTFRPPSRSAVRAGFVRWPSGGASVYFGRYEPDLTRATIGSLKAGGVFFDIGANVGYYSVLASRLVGETGMVVAFEPLVRNIYYLYYHVMLNRCSNVVIVPAACADISGAVPFLQGRNPAEGKILSDWGGSEALPVPAVTIDDVCALLQVRVGAMKIDVEGAELKVLRGAQNTLAEAKPFVFLSVHSDDLRDACITFLARYGYHIEPIGLSGSEFIAIFRGGA